MAAVGEYTLAMAVATPIYTFLGFNFRGALASSRLVGTSLPVLVRFKGLTATIAAAVTLGVLLNSYHSQVGWALALGVCLMKSADAMFDLPYGEWLRRGWLYTYSLSQIFRGLVLCLVTVIILSRGESIGVALVWVGLGWVLAPGLLEYIHLWRLPPNDATNASSSPAAASVRAIMASTWTLGVAVCLLQIHNNLPRYVLAKSVDYEAVGRYSCYYYLIFAGHLAITAIGQTFAGSLGRAWLNAEMGSFRRAARRLLQSALVVHVGAILVVLVAGKWVLPLLYGSRANLSVTECLSVVIGCGGSLYIAALGVPLTATGEYRTQIIAFAAAAGLSLALSYVVLPRGGMHTVAFANGVGSLVGALVCLKALSATVRRREAATPVSS